MRVSAAGFAATFRRAENQPEKSEREGEVFLADYFLLRRENLP